MILLDSHALAWWLSGTAQLSARAGRAIRDALREGPVLASTMSIFEIVVVARRGRLQLSAPAGEWVRHLLNLPEVRVEPVTPEIAEMAASFGAELHGDPADRIILATSRIFGCTLVTADSRLRQAGVVQTVW